MIRIPSCGHWCCATPKRPPVDRPTCDLDLPADHPDHRDAHPADDPGDCAGCDGVLHAMEAFD